MDKRIRNWCVIIAATGLAGLVMLGCNDSDSGGSSDGGGGGGGGADAGVGSVTRQ
ncbi:MAG: hypothetical protein QGH42_00130 [Kiritimatiellia bacterium]|jgi:hypothetical protein|nr:hypothetical protein [Kiritimatiellia bacterium]MDP6631669.1 hypothetical protein [Kiritimatiellia bacterium]MDP6810767.1 hypothetical protein [Kiritimatiellia bacterium]MDP7022642.1 hypothetical protein [Kiritimatiellia bacterium]